ncbi:MAG: NAD(P)-binding domain-containing protein [Opitutales bacterium]|nr:NAD(P)-binding domain-containing protein [Opitutales bacterium]NRA27764.1 NAD(P)-binding domain-containing protein [Opitutales bacterium]
MEIDAIIVGAGPAGIGSALALRRAGVKGSLVLEANEVGSSFLKWPEQMRLITPSFHGNPFFQTDLNAVTPDSSPADFTLKEHLSGNEYARYLKATVRHFSVNVREGEKVQSISREGGCYAVHTPKVRYKAKNVIWAGGEFSHPQVGSFSGAEHCVHSSMFRSWKDFQGDDALIIGGYESGIDAACNLLDLGKRVVVISSGEPWKVDHPDPSESLSPYTRERFMNALKAHTGRIALVGNSTVSQVSQLSGRYVVETDKGEVFDTDARPIAAIGFHSALHPVKDLWGWNGSLPKFTEDDQSTLSPGMYYSGPSLIQRKSKFCFIYKFRARFGVVARSVARRLGLPEPDLQDDIRRGFLVDDLECCTQCECAVESEAASVNASS